MFVIMKDISTFTALKCVADQLNKRLRTVGISVTSSCGLTVINVLVDLIFIENYLFKHAIHDTTLELVAG